MTRRLPHLLLAAFTLLHVGCGYVMAGTWEDDPGNWKRAFRSTKPDDVVVVHSRYWRSRHWSYEFEYFFEIAPNAKLREQLFSENNLRRITGDAADVAKRDVFGDAPSWFAPKPVAEYEVWVMAGEPARNFIVLIDRTSGQLFMRDYQV